MSNQHKIWFLMSRSIFGEATDAERLELDQLLNNDPNLQQQYDLLLHTLNTRPATTNNFASEFDSRQAEMIIAKAKILADEKPVQRKYVKKIIYWAAASLLFIMLGVKFFTNSKKITTENKKPALIAKNGSRKQTILPDGSKVWLNAGSELFYLNDFKGATREVRLEGEAFFDIAKNPAKPFIVHANKFDIKVLGTAFNVKAYKEDRNVETTLYRGLVNISKADDNNFQPIMLYPNQKLILPKESFIAEKETGPAANTAARVQQKSITIKEIDSTKVEEKRIETAWIYNRLEFRGDDFATLAAKLQRWYNVKIDFSDENVQKLTFNGSFENETIEQAMLALKTANSFKYKISNNEILISSSK